MIIQQSTTFRNAALSTVCLLAISTLVNVVVFSGDPVIQFVAMVVLSLGVLLSVLVHTRLLSITNVALSLWIILISNRVFLVRAEGGMVASGNFSRTIIIEIAITCLIFMSTMVLLAVRRIGYCEPLKIFGARSWLAFYAGFATLSLLWTPSLLYAGFWLMRLLSVVLLMILYFEDSDEHKVQRFVTATTLGHLPHLMLVTLAVKSHVGLDMRVTGFWLHPCIASILGYSLTMFFITKFIQQKQGRTKYLFLAIFSFFNAFVAGGKAGALGAIIACIFLLPAIRGASARFYFAVVLLIMGLAIGIIQSHFEIGLLKHWTYYDKEIRFGTLYSRLDLWKTAIDMWLSNWWSAVFGYGFTSLQVMGIAGASGLRHTTSHAHNSFLTALVNSGIVGTMPLILMLCATLRLIVSHLRFVVESSAYPLVVGLSVLLAGSLTDNVFGNTLQPTSYLLMMYVVAIEVIIKNRKQSKV